MSESPSSLVGIKGRPLDLRMSPIRRSDAWQGSVVVVVVHSGDRNQRCEYLSPRWPYFYTCAHWPRLLAEHNGAFLPRYTASPNSRVCDCGFRAITRARARTRVFREQPDFREQFLSFSFFFLCSVNL